MSEELNDASEIFAKMQELQRSIEETKKSLTANNSKPIPASFNGNRNLVSRGRPYFRARGGFRGSLNGSGWGRGRTNSRKPFRNMSLVLNNSAQSSEDVALSEKEGENTNNDQFVSKVSLNGLSLVNTRIFESDRQRQLALNQRILQKKIDKLQHVKKLKIQQKLQELSVKYDYCNRAIINGIEMALVNDGIRLVPISYIEDKDYKNNIEFEGYKYTKLGDGSYLREDHDENKLSEYVSITLYDLYQNLLTHYIGWKKRNLVVFIQGPVRVTKFFQPHRY